MKLKSSMRSRIQEAVINDPTTIKDAVNFRKKWGEWPIGFKFPKEWNKGENQKTVHD